MKRKMGLLVAAALVMAMTFVGVAEAKTSPVMSYNEDAGVYEYEQWSHPMKSYLVAEGDGFIRVEKLHYPKERLIVEKYDNSFNCTERIDLEVKLPIFGGFFAGKDAYYVVFGDENSEESDAKEVILIEKYDKNWNLVGQTSVKGINTTVPFDAGNLRMAEYGGSLYVRTSHEMYKTSDGKHHQANLMIQIRQSDMTLVDTFHKVWNMDSGYVSHSFNQFIMVDWEGRIVAADHGDAHPRSMVLFKYDNPAGSQSFVGDAKNYEAKKLKGPSGENYTNATLGGLEYSKTHGTYLIAGSSAEQDNKWDKYATRNIFVGVVASDMSKGYNNWITAIEEGKGSVRNPQLVKFNENKFLVLWGDGGGNSSSGKIGYTTVNGAGDMPLSVKKVKGNTSDCQPVVKDGKAIWYVTNSDSLKFYSIDEKGNFKVEKIHLAKVKGLSARRVSGGVKLTWNGHFEAKSYAIYRQEGASGKWVKIATVKKNAISYTDRTVKKGVKYTYRIKAASDGNYSPYSVKRSVNY